MFSLVFSVFSSLTNIYIYIYILGRPVGISMPGPGPGPGPPGPPWAPARPPPTKALSVRAPENPSAEGSFNDRYTRAATRMAMRGTRTRPGPGAGPGPQYREEEGSGLRSAAQTPGKPLRLLWRAPSPSVMNSGVVPSEMESLTLEVVRLNDGCKSSAETLAFLFFVFCFSPRSDHRLDQQKQT